VTGDLKDIVEISCKKDKVLYLSPHKVDKGLEQKEGQGLFEINLSILLY
jgi:hypothetical protein